MLKKQMGTREKEKFCDSTLTVLEGDGVELWIGTIADEVILLSMCTLKVEWRRLTYSY